jgi:hypothetical protein
MILKQLMREPLELSSELAGMVDVESLNGRWFFQKCDGSGGLEARASETPSHILVLLLYSWLNSEKCLIAIT